MNAFNLTSAYSPGWMFVSWQVVRLLFGNARYGSDEPTFISLDQFRNITDRHRSRANHTRVDAKILFRVFHN